MDKDKEKSNHAKREEETLAFWKKGDIFAKSLARNKGKKEFIFYEGPPTANGRPGIHHLEARAFKDAIPRYKTMQGYYVRRKGGWDTHGLPVELQVEKELGLKSKKEIEAYGVGAFNEKCKASVWQYVHEWEEFTERMGYWVDLKNPYITYKSEYIESLWNIIKVVNDKGLLYKDYKVVPWCPRCGTALSSHELAQGYEEVKDISVYIKFKITNYKLQTNSKLQITNEKTYLLAWTTTPWTLPGNVALAVGQDIDYVKIEITGEDSYYLILAKDKLSVLKEKYKIVETFKGKDLVGIEYEPLYPFVKDNISGEEKNKMKNAYKVYSADFVTTEDGTGIVHTAVMYGQDDFELGNKIGLPKYHLVNDDGTFKKEAGFLANSFVKDQNTEVAIIKDLSSRDLLFAKEKYAHSYPFCWRCKTPLIYYARDSWYIRMSSLRDTLVKENKKINWVPEYIKEGRFGEWLSEVKDWAISRERYWGTPLPVWICHSCNSKKVIGSIDEIKQKSRNEYFVMRHGEAENNTLGVLSGKADFPHHLTDKGRKQVEGAAKEIKKIKPDLVFISPFVRTRETANILKENIGWSDSMMIVDDRLQELGTGAWNGKSVEEYRNAIPLTMRFEKKPEGGETYAEIKKRVGDFLYEIESKYFGKKILIITHDVPAMLLQSVAHGWDRVKTLTVRGEDIYLENAEVKSLNMEILPHNNEYETDLHKPHIDKVTLACKCGQEMKRVKEVMDVWFDSGAMPFAEDHYPFENKKRIQGVGYPADFISEAIDQTRGWFYTLHAIGNLLGKGRAYNNVVSLGHVLDAEGKKMSKSLGNVVNPWDMMDKYGADAVRFWMYSVNQAGDAKNFDEKTVDEVVKKVFNLILNVLSFYGLYANKDISEDDSDKSENILDRWIIAKTNALISDITNGLDRYNFYEPTRAIREFVADLSQWYLRRSRDRFKKDGVDKVWVLATMKYVLLTLSRVMAPFAPFVAEYIYKNVGGKLESVHLEKWPKVKISKTDKKMFEDMEFTRMLASKGLEARMVSGINVRQPLNKFKIQNPNFKTNPKSKIQNNAYVELIKDEINVKEVIFDDTIKEEVELDTNITPELKEEGNVREFIRIVQDLRKDKGLTVKDRVDLMVSTDDRGKAFLAKNKSAIVSATLLKDIKFEDFKSDKTIAIDSTNFYLDLR